MADAMTSGLADFESAIDTSSRFRFHAAVAAVIGLCLAFLSLDAAFLLGVGPKWDNPTGDISTFRVASIYYLNDGWHLPLLKIPEIGYPEGGNVVYADALPLAAIPAKLLATVTGLHVNFLGPWMLVCYTLQTVLLARLAFLLGNRSLILTAALSCFAAGCLMFLLRAQHTAMCSHFVIFWALIVYLRLRTPGVALMRTILPPIFVSFFINPYMWAMVVPIVAAGVVSAWPDAAMRRQIPRTLVVGGVLGVLAIAVCGFMPTSGSVRTVSDSGFGHASWNPASLVVPPPHGFWQPWTASIVRDATRGQYEGESYLGFGPLLLLACCVWLYPRQVLARLSQHKVLCLVMAGFALDAMSNRGYIRSWPVWDITLPGRVMEAASVFRSSGRFIWPIVYLLMLLPALECLRRAAPARRPFWLAFLVLAGVFQIVETTPARAYMKEWTRTPAPDLTNRDWLAGVIKQHQRVWQYPSYACGGLGLIDPVLGQGADLQVQLLTAKANVPMNSFYMGRKLKDCDRERREALALTLPLEPGVLYLFSKDALMTTPSLQMVAASPACTHSLVGAVCSQTFATARAASLAK